MVFQVSLDSLDADLKKHAQHLHSILIEVVNEDYDKFLSLSTKLVDLSSLVPELEAPLRAIQAKIQDARSQVEEQASTLQDGLRRRQAVTIARNYLEVAQDATHVMAKIEKFLGDLQTDVNVPQTDEDHETLEGRCRLLDRLASEVGRLQFYFQKGSNLVAVQSLETRKKLASNTLQESLDKTLNIVLDVQNPAAFGILLHAYATLGWNRAAEEVVRRAIICPAVSSAIKNTESRSKIEKKPGTTEATHINFYEILPVIEEAVIVSAGPFLQLALGLSSGASSFDFLGGSVLPEVFRQAEIACPEAYSVGNPELFFLNFNASNRFLQYIENLCGTQEQLHRLHRSAAWIKHAQNWKLSVYFSMKNKVIAGKLEEQLQNLSAGDVAKERNAGFRCEGSVQTWKAILSCFSKEIYIKDLGDKFLRLAVQIVARYSAWIKDLVFRQENKGPDGSGFSDASDNTDRHEAVHNPGEDSLSELLATWQDIKTMSSFLDSEFNAKIIDLLNLQDKPGKRSSEALKALETLIKEAIIGLHETQEDVLQKMSMSLSSRCCEYLKQLRGIVATFRMAQRAAPTRPAQYASNLLTPLKLYLEDESSFLPEDDKKMLAKLVVEKVAENYRQVASETLDTARKTESSLRRLRNRKDTDKPDTDTTENLISTQLLLDINEFEKNAAKCYVDDMDTNDSYIKLKSVIKK